MPTKIRREEPADAGQISEVITLAFKAAKYTSNTEARIVERLRAAGALSLSLVAEDSNTLVGQVAFSPIRIGGHECGWFGLGPLAVLPSKQRAGIGHELVTSGLRHLRDFGARGCVVLGDPAYYSRFGFVAIHRLRLPGVPAEYFQTLSFAGDDPVGDVSYRAEFGID